MHKGINTTADEGQTPIIQHGGGFDGADVAHALRGEGFDASEDGTGRGTPIVPVAIQDTRGMDKAQNGKGWSDDGTSYTVDSLATQGVVQPHPIAIQERAVSENPGTGPDGKGWRDDGAAYTLEARQVSQAVTVPFDTTQITSAANYSNPQPGDPCHPLAAAGHAPTIAFTAKDHGGDAPEGISPTLRAGGHTGSHANAGVMPAIAFEQPEPFTIMERGRDGQSNLESRQDGTANAILTPNGGRGGLGVGAIAAAWGVRRLTPTECERLQGFPDGWSAIPDWNGFRPVGEGESLDELRAAGFVLRKGKKGWRVNDPDGPRYKALGNSMATPCMEWIGTRIEAIRAATGGQEQ